MIRGKLKRYKQRVSPREMDQNTMERPKFSRSVKDHRVPDRPLEIKLGAFYRLSCNAAVRIVGNRKGFPLRELMRSIAV